MIWCGEASKVDAIGQAFADEIFRVFANEHPEISLHAIHTSSEVKRMIDRVRGSRSSDDAS